MPIYSLIFLSLIHTHTQSFKLTNPTSGQFVYAGVKDFSSPSRDVAYLPQWMMEHLGAREGDQMIFEHVDLVPGTLVKLQPNSSTWLGIPEGTRKELMESHLREFQTLTEGMVITLTYELNRYNLKVLKCQPSQGILIQDIDIPTDVAEPADLADGNYSVVEGQAIKVGLDEPFRCQAEAKQYKYFMLFTGHQLPSRLSIEVKPIRGDPDLFISQSCITPSQSRYTWCNQDVGYSVIELSDEFDVNRPLFAGIVCLCEDSEFVITFVRRDTLAAARDRNSSTAGKNLRDTNQNSIIPTTVGSTSPTEEYERCYYCHRVMQAHLMVMHERHCAQQTFKCPTCDACVPKSAENKHHLIFHEPLICECGCRLPQIDLHKHQEQDCIKRSVKCQFKLCNLWFPMDELLDHETLCETKCVPCPECQQEFMQKEVEEHMKSCHLTPDNANVV